MRLKGFKEQPVDHYVRTYFLSAEPMYHRFRDGCAGSELRHIRFFNYFRDLYHMYGAKRKFMFGFHSELSHDDNSHLKKVRLGLGLVVVVVVSGGGGGVDCQWWWWWSSVVVLVLVVSSGAGGGSQ